MSFTQEMKRLGKAGEGVDARCCREAVLFLHQELGRNENALGRAAWTMRYGQRAERWTALHEGAAKTLPRAHPDRGLILDHAFPRCYVHG